MKKMIPLLFSMVYITVTAFSQNVGIGTAAPEGLLHVKGSSWTKAVLENNAGEARGYIGTDNNGTITIGTNAYWNGTAWVYPNTGSSMYLLMHRLNNRYEFRVRPDGGSQATAMTIDTGSNVIIGGNLVIDQKNGNTGSIGNTIRFGNFSGEGIGSKRNSGTGQYGLDFYTNSINRMTVTNNGNVGIGSLTPVERLGVNGAINIGTTTSNTTGTIRFNASNNDFEGYDGSQWRSLTAGGGVLAPKTISPSNVSAGSKLGFSVAIGSEYAFAGAPLDDISGQIDQGSVLVYRKHPVTGNWDYYQKITLPNGSSGDQFGYALSFNGKYLAVGVPYRDISGNTDCGAVTIFLQNKNTGVWEWYQNTELTRQNAGSNFGYAIHLNNQALLIGAPKEDVGAKADAGAAYLFYYELSGAGGPNPHEEFYAPQGAIVSSDVMANDNYGSTVKIIRGAGTSFDFALIGAPNSDPDAVNNAGTIYIARFVSDVFGGYYAFEKLVAPDKTSDDNFGYSANAEFSNGILIMAVGSKKESSTQANQGKVYLYQKENIANAIPLNLVLSSSFTSNDGTAADFFGASLTIINSQAILIGSPGNVDGAVYRYIANGIQNWGADKKITDPQPGIQQNFGYSQAINNGVFICGAPAANSNTGKVYFCGVAY
jgi:FG-GAP repeat